MTKGRNQTRTSRWFLFCSLLAALATNNNPGSANPPGSGDLSSASGWGREGRMLTKKQYELLLFIDKRLKENGVSPSFDEMKDAPGFARNPAFIG